MKPFLCALVAGLALTSVCAGRDTGESDGGTCYIIPISGTIERGLVYVVRRGVARAVADDAEAIVFEMDTPGGRLDAAKEIVRIISRADVKTVTYVNPDAISAGAIIAMGTDAIYMAPGSRIGDAMPIMVSPFGGVQEIPDGYEEKAVSYVSGLIRSTAETKGHDPDLAEAMVRRELEYKLGDDVISKEGELLTLTSEEAARQVVRDDREEPLLSLGTVDDLDALRAELGLENAQVRTLAVSPAEKVARYIEMFSAFLLIGGLLGLYIEFKTPGFGVPGIAGILLLVVWFWGHHVAGLAGMGEVVLFILGVTFLAVEIFVIPGFGLIGISGLVMIVASLAMAMVQHYPGIPWYAPPPEHLQRAVLTLGLALSASFLLMYILARFLPETHAFQRLTLAADLGTDAGYTASDSSDDLAGATGRTETALRPAGIAIVNGRRLNVVARGAFIDKGAPIVVAETHGNRIVVDADTSTSA